MVVVLKIDIFIPNLELFIKAGTRIFVDRTIEVGYCDGIHFDLESNEYWVIH